MYPEQSERLAGPLRAAIGIAGIRHLEQPDGDADLFGNPSKPVMNRVDEIASAASILMGQTAAARPVVIGRGIPLHPGRERLHHQPADPSAAPRA